MVDFVFVLLFVFVFVLLFVFVFVLLFIFVFVFVEIDDVRSLSSFSQPY